MQAEGKLTTSDCEPIAGGVVWRLSCLLSQWDGQQGCIAAWSSLPDELEMSWRCVEHELSVSPVGVELPPPRACAPADHHPLSPCERWMVGTEPSSRSEEALSPPAGEGQPL